MKDYESYIECQDKVAEAFQVSEVYNNDKYFCTNIIGLWKGIIYIGTCCK